MSTFLVKTRGPVLCSDTALAALAARLNAALPGYRFRAAPLSAGAIEVMDWPGAGHMEQRMIRFKALPALEKYTPEGYPTTPIVVGDSGCASLGTASYTLSTPRGGGHVIELRFVSGWGAPEFSEALRETIGRCFALM